MVIVVRPFAQIDDSNNTVRQNTNYDSNNTGCEDGSSLDPADVDCCNYNVGCSDPTAANYTDSSGLSPAYLIDCNSSVPPHLQVAYGSNSLLTVSGENYVDTINDLSYDARDNNDCCEIITGCMDDDADNYNSLAGVAGTCEYLIGCAINYYSFVFPSIEKYKGLESVKSLQLSTYLLVSTYS